MRLFNVGSLFNENAIGEMVKVVGDPEKLKQQAIHSKKMILQAYRPKAYRQPEDFKTASYILATNHLTDTDAPILMSYYYEQMLPVLQDYPRLFVFAKENCFNGVSIPKELMPLLDLEKVMAVDRGSPNGSMAAMKAAAKWFAEGEKPKHYLIFAQGTIFDVNKDEAEDIEPGAFWLSKRLGIPVLPAFIEQAVEGEENRIVFAEPFAVPKDCRDFHRYKQLWLDRVIEAQNALEPLTGTPARDVVLDADHQTRKRFRTGNA